MIMTPQDRRVARYVWLTILHVCAITDVSSARKREKDFPDLIVDTELGRVRGIRYHLPQLGKGIRVDTYLGIPFAKPPLNHLRFRHPLPMDKWDNIYNATKSPNSCYQGSDDFFGDFRGSTMWNPNTRISEDCLYLNVWVPRRKSHPRLRKSAVMVWIYGGGFYSGTATLNVYDGKILAALNDVIVVSLQYRVGAFGFLTLNHPGATGNAGMFDQLMGLEWVQKNIKHFGGDPYNVTLFGESAGSVSVSLHLISPLSHDKFQRAIMQSGSANMPWAIMSTQEARRRSLEMAEILDCDLYDHQGDLDEVLKCLREKSAQEIITHFWVSRGIAQFPFTPVVDGAFLPAYPDEVLEKKQFKKCPILLGSNKNEASFFVIYDLNDRLTRNSTSMTRIEFEKSMEQLFNYYPQYPEQPNKFVKDAIFYQYTNWVDRDDQVANIQKIDDAVSESQFLCSINYFAQAYAEAGENVFSYYFTERIDNNPWPEWMGVLHADEIMFIFGEPFKQGQNYTTEEMELSIKMMKYWTNFAKTGDPNEAPTEASLNEWPIYTPRGKEYLDLNAKHLDNDDPSLAIGHGLRIKNCAFWKEYIPNLITHSAGYKIPSSPPSVDNVVNVTCHTGALYSGSELAASNSLIIVFLLSFLCAMQIA